jgi:hypothetical protein
MMRASTSAAIFVQAPEVEGGTVASLRNRSSARGRGFAPTVVKSALFIWLGAETSRSETLACCAITR